LLTIYNDEEVRMNQFQCITLSHAELSPNIAIAATRAGGVGILDCEYAMHAERVTENICKLVQSKGKGSIGIKLHSYQDKQADLWLKALTCEAPVVIISWTGETFSRLDKLVQKLKREHSNINILIELTRFEQLAKVQHLTGIDGVVAKGHESGGWVGEDAAFILSQKLMGKVDVPVYIQGGIGIHSAAACRAFGAAGVVLEEQLFLMPESGLKHIRPLVEGINGKVCVAVGEHFGAPCRILDLPRMQGAQDFKALCDSIDMQAQSLAQTKDIWQEKAQQNLAWSDERKAWPMGQAIALAESFLETYKTTGRAVQAIVKQSEALVTLAQQNQVIVEHSPLAQSHRTTYPFVQGPMTRVSDTPGFAKAIADGGALPLIALAVLKAEQVDTILTESAALLHEQSWGVGLLGFIEQSLYEAQLKSVLKHKPPFALIAGGRPDQAKRLEDEGISTYIHAPTPELLRMFITQGARKFVFEGRECGGHVGPLSSFVLWEQMIAVLLSDMPKGKEAEFQLLFAGGIHDGLSAAMVNVLAAPLVSRGAKVGVLMGTIYLFTEEAVSQGSILPEFQNQAIKCESTINLVTGPGHASRCVNTTFAEEFYATRRKLLKEGLPSSDVSSQLDSLSLGRLRIASKGVKRDKKGNVVKVGRDEQLLEGMYMIGQVATLHHERTTIAELHTSIVSNSKKRMQEMPVFIAKDEKPSRPLDIAIIGLSTLLPGAQDVETYWDNILNKLDVISEIPPERWDWRLYFDADRKEKDKIYMKTGGFFGEVPFDPMDFGIPPNSLRTIEPIQLLTLGVVKQALIDAGYADGQFDKEHTSVILGASGGLGDLGVQYAARTELDKVVGKPNKQILDRLPDWTEESFSGLLLNVTAGRVANRFDLGGTNQTVDAACGSSLAALKNAVQELESGISNMAIAGGIDTMMSPFSYMCFAKTQALSPSGTPKPFDKNSDGIVISEGISVVVLKRLADAERDGDRIYGVIKGMGSSSDGRALGMTAPLPKGQMRALDRAYKQAGYTPDTVTLFEAHGTGTNAGDKAESETIINTLKKFKAKPKRSALGSVKSQIGHTKATAGTAALIKTVLSLYYKVQPPHMNVSEPLDIIADSQSPVFILNQKRPWFASPEHPRRAGVSAFGFGGTNYHATLEEYQGTLVKKPTGALKWSCELFVFKAESKERLLKVLQQLQHALKQGSQPELHDLAAAYAYQSNDKDRVCLSFVVENLEELQTHITTSVSKLEALDSSIWEDPLYFNEDLELASPKLAFMYPGQGAQYVNMGLEHALFFDDVRGSFEKAGQVLSDAYSQPLWDIVFPPSAYNKEDMDKQRAAITHTHIAQPALAAYSLGLTQLLKRIHIIPDVIAGHSLGEYSALCASGVFTEQALYDLVEVRGRLMGSATEGVEGAMAAVKLSRQDVESWLNGVQDVVIANHNAPMQTIISGEKLAIETLLKKMEKAGVAVRLLPVSGAFHSPLLAKAQKPLADAIQQTVMFSPNVDVYANKTGQPYASDTTLIKKQLSEHLLGSVEFVQQVENMYEAGVRVFVEVGAKNILSNLVKQVLGDKPYTCIALDQRNGTLKGLLQSFSSLVPHCRQAQWQVLFDNRGIEVKKPSQVLDAALPKALGKTSYWISGDKVRHHSEPKGSNGRAPMLTLETQQMMTQGQAMSEGHPLNDVLLSYQQTMRDFLALQEKVVTGYIQDGVLPTTIKGNSLKVAAEPFSGGETVEQFNNAKMAVEDSALTTVDEQPSLLPLLVSIVAERTGYPEDMLDPDQDMEAELGIDSIKRVEIMGTLQERLPADVVSQLQSHMDTISRTKSLREMVDQIEALAPHTHMATAADESSVITSTSDVPSLLPLLVSIVAERTGYPEDMLDPDQDMEAELGIDSIKRVEIMGTLQERLPADVVSQLQSHMDTISRTKSLREMVDQIEALQLTQAVQESSQGKEEEISKPVAHVITHDLPRFVMKEVELDDCVPVDLSNQGYVLLTPDTQSVAQKVAQRLKDKGIAVRIIPETMLHDVEQLKDWVNQLLMQQGSVLGLIHLSGLIEHAEKTEQACKASAQVCLQTLFSIIKPLFQRQESDQSYRVLTASLLQAHDVLSHTYPPAMAAGAKAMLKTLQHEYPSTYVRSIDFDADISPKKMAEFIVDEYLDQDSTYVEIRYQGKKRLAIVPEPKPLILADEAVLEPKDWVILVTGGAKGITAEILKDLAPFHPRLLLIGRTQWSREYKDPMPDVLEEDKMRDTLIAQAHARGEKISPKNVAQTIKAIQGRRIMCENIQALEGLGAHVDYLNCDVVDGVAFSTLIEDIYQEYGRIDAVIHAAGIIEDQLLVNKSEASFNRVVDTKVLSACTLVNHLRSESLKLFVFFSSISGRFGNLGQIDYSAANEVLNELAIQCKSEWSNVRVKSINWGPWVSSTGMVTEAAETQMATMGIGMISPEAGRLFFKQEALQSHANDVVVVASSLGEYTMKHGTLG